MAKPFYKSPTQIAQIKIEFLYEHLYDELCSTVYLDGKIPTQSVLEYIQNDFEQLFAHVARLEHRETQHSFWKAKDKNSKLLLEFSNLSFTSSFDMARGADEESSDKCQIAIASTNPQELERVASNINALKTEPSSQVFMLVQSYGESFFKPIDLGKIDIPLDLNYGADFVQVSANLIESLNTRNAGLYLFYGEPGTGKSSYIKYLLSGVLNRKVVYVPVGMIGVLTTPEFLPLLMENKGAVLVVEDAEKALLSRDDSDSGASIVSTVLNLTDGFVSEALNISIVATFNTDKDNLDKALLRKGRLKGSYEFKKLSIKDSKRLLAHLNVEHDVQQEMTLAEIYNVRETLSFKEPAKKVIVGFGG